MTRKKSGNACTSERRLLTIWGGANRPTRVSGGGDEGPLGAVQRLCMVYGSQLGVKRKGFLSYVGSRRLISEGRRKRTPPRKTKRAQEEKNRGLMTAIERRQGQRICRTSCQSVGKKMKSPKSQWGGELNKNQTIVDTRRLFAATRFGRGRQLIQIASPGGMAV